MLVIGITYTINPYNDNLEIAMPYNFLRRFVTRVIFALAVFLPGFAFAQTLLSQNMPVVQSSQEAALAATAAVDGNTSTRWGSAFTDNEWIYVDLGKAA